MGFVTHLPRTSRGPDAMWVIVDQLTKLAIFLAMWMTFTLDESCRLYMREIIWLHGVPVSIVSDQDPDSFLEEFPTSHGDTVDDEHRFSSLEGQSVEEDHPDFRRHATSMCPRSQG